jgi:hypothetical protein
LSQFFAKPCSRNWIFDPGANRGSIPVNSKLGITDIERIGLYIIHET